MGEHPERSGRYPMSSSERSILVVVHSRRDDTVEAARRVLSELRSAGALPVLSAEDRAELDDLLDWEGVGTLGFDVALAEIELAIVLGGDRSEEHTSELQSLMRISYAVFCLKKKNKKNKRNSLKTDTCMNTCTYNR